MWVDSIRLVNGYNEVTDENGIVTQTPLYSESIPANFLSAKRADKTLANQSGYTADEVIEIMACNYNKQGSLVDDKDNEVYEVKDTFHDRKKETIQLTCQRR